jgi:hypothetical protein
LTDAQRRFVDRAVRRKNLFLGLALAGIAVAVVLAAVFALGPRAAGTGRGARAVIVLLVLLNARQNLRQYRYAAALEALRRAAPREGDADGRSAPPPTP